MRIVDYAIALGLAVLTPVAGVAATDSTVPSEVSVAAESDGVVPGEDQYDPAGVMISLRNIGGSWCRGDAQGLPPGLEQTGAQFYYTVTGVPTTPGVYPVTITDCGEDAHTKTFTWTIGEVPVRERNLETAGDHTDRAGEWLHARTIAHSTCLLGKADGLPSGLHVSAGDGPTVQVYGTPTSPGIYPVTVSVNCGGQDGILSDTFTWTVTD